MSNKQWSEQGRVFPEGTACSLFACEGAKRARVSPEGTAWARPCQSAGVTPGARWDGRAQLGPGRRIVAGWLKMAGIAMVGAIEAI